MELHMVFGCSIHFGTSSYGYGVGVLKEWVLVHEERDILQKNLIDQGQEFIGWVISKLPGTEGKEFTNFAKEPRSFS